MAQDVGRGYRERFLALLDGRFTDRPVWTADLTWWMDSERRRGAEGSWDEEGHLELCGRLGVMPYYWYGNFWLAEPDYDATVRVVEADRGDIHVRAWRTPVGEIAEETSWFPESRSVACLRHAVSTPEDLRVLLYVMEHRRLRPVNLDGYPGRFAHWAAADGIPSIALPRSPLPGFLHEWAGVQDGLLLLADRPAEVGELLDLMERQEEPVLEAVCHAAPPLVHFADNLSADTLTGLFDGHMADRYRARLARLHAAGVKAAVHLDGVVRGLLPRLAAVGVDAAEALTPRPAGDLDAAGMRDLSGDGRMILWGGVPGVLFAPPYRWPDMERHVRGVLDAWRGCRFVLGVGDQVPPDGDVGFCARIAEML